MATATATPPRRRHAATGAAAGEWAALSASGEWRAEAIGKHQLVRRTGLSARDLRALDPALSHPSSVMARDRAVVVNLDRVRAVITATEVLVPGPRDPSVAPLVAELRTRLAAASPAPPRAVSVCLCLLSLLLVSVHPNPIRLALLDCFCLRKISSFGWVEGRRGREGRGRLAAERRRRWQGAAVRVQGAGGVPRVRVQVTRT